MSEAATLGEAMSTSGLVGVPKPTTSTPTLPPSWSVGVGSPSTAAPRLISVPLPRGAAPTVATPKTYIPPKLTSSSPPYAPYIAQTQQQMQDYLQNGIPVVSQAEVDNRREISQFESLTGLDIAQVGVGAAGYIGGGVLVILGFIVLAMSWS